MTHWPSFNVGDRVITPTGKVGVVVPCDFEPGALTLVQFPDGTKLIFTDILKRYDRTTEPLPDKPTTRSRKPRRAVQRVHSVVDSDRD